MKRFLTRLLAFASIAGVAVAAWSGIIALQECRYWKRACAMPDGKSVVVCCDSQTEVSLNPAYWPELFNQSRSGTRLTQYAMRLEDVLAANPGKIRAGLIDVSPLKFYLTQADDEPNGPGEKELAALHLLHADRNEVSVLSLLDDFYSVVWPHQSKRAFGALFRGKYKSYLVGGYLDMVAQTFVDHPQAARAKTEAWAEKVNAAFARQDSKSHVFRALDDLIGMYGKAGARVVVIQSPLHHVLRRRIGEALEHETEEMRRYCARRKIAYLDYASMDFADDEWSDCNHLNVRGARRLTERLRKDVAAALKEDER